MIDIEEVAHDVVDAAIKVHISLGPGLLESAYRECHAFELRKRGRKVLTELKLPLVYEGIGLMQATVLMKWWMISSLLRTKQLSHFSPSIKHS